MSLNKKDLLRVFDEATDRDYPYVFVKVEAEGIEELIIIPRRSFEAKKDFYTNAYNDDLTHVMNKNVKLTDLGYGNELEISNFI